MVETYVCGDFPDFTYIEGVEIHGFPLKDLQGFTVLCNQNVVKPDIIREKAGI